MNTNLMTRPSSMSSLEMTVSNNVCIYNIGGEEHLKKLPVWMMTAGQRKRLNKEDTAWSRRVQLVQDFGFPEAASKIAFTPDGKHIISTGTYKPQMRVYELADAAMKFERHTTAETVAFQILGEDWTKTALIQADRTVEIHAAGGHYFTLRIPKVGRDLAYYARSAELLIAPSAAQLYRLSLERGQLLSPLDVDASSINCVRVSKVHGLVCIGCEASEYNDVNESSSIEFWDLRSRRRLRAITLNEKLLGMNAFQCQNYSKTVTSVNLHGDGTSYSLGTADGRILLFDLRASRPMAQCDHMNGYEIRKLTSLNGGKKLVSSDKRGIKIWNVKDLSLWTTVESPYADVNDFDVQDGLVIVANESPSIGCHYIPSLGPAPSWCSYLENVTEEMEEGSGTRESGNATIANYRFVTLVELEALGLDHLVGTSVLRAYMHGFFIDMKLYEKARAIADPFAHEAYVQRVRAEKLEKARQSRISSTIPNAKARVNLALRERLQNNALSSKLDEEACDNNERNSKTEKKRMRDAEVAKSILEDSRFSALFQDEEFAFE